MRKRKKPKFIIEEIRNENKVSKFILKEKVMFWWEKIPLYPLYFNDKYTFLNFKTGIDYIDKHRGELVSIKINKKIK